ncbi:MAG: hypothetical protein JO023_29470 [Chloroflexi bacterium]|nr:hypothetical protein [Chloroflexota bacterium]
MAQYDVTRTNQAIERLLEVTTNPRHRFLLQSYYRHRYLEIAGRYEEIFAPEMTVEHPVYHFHAVGIDTTLEGTENVRNLYRQWAELGQSIFYAENEQVAVADNYVASMGIVYQQIPGQVLAAAGKDVDRQATYLYRTVEEMVWPYDDRGRMVGEDVWEPDPQRAELIKLDPADVVTTAQARVLLDPLIKPQPAFDSATMAPGLQRS